MAHHLTGKRSFLQLFGILGANLFPKTEDVQLGKQIDGEIRKNPKKYSILQGRPEIKAYVGQIGKKILASPEIRNREIHPYQYEVINDDSTVNAFCTPSGYV